MFDLKRMQIIGLHPLFLSVQFGMNTQTYQGDAGIPALYIDARTSDRNKRLTA